LKCKKVFHAVGPHWSGGKKDEEKLLKKAVANCLNMASEEGLKSISLPAISSGVYGFPKDKCAEVLFACAIDHFDNDKDGTLEEIRFVNFDDETVFYFETEFENRFGKYKKNDLSSLKEDKFEIDDDIDEEDKSNNKKK